MHGMSCRTAHACGLRWRGHPVAWQTHETIALSVGCSSSISFSSAPPFERPGLLSTHILMPSHLLTVHSSPLSHLSRRHPPDFPLSFPLTLLPSLTPKPPTTPFPHAWRSSGAIRKTLPFFKPQRTSDSQRPAIFSASTLAVSPCCMGRCWTALACRGAVCQCHYYCPRPALLPACQPIPQPFFSSECN